MRALAIALLCLVLSTFTAAQQGNTEDQIKKYEQDWSQEIVKDAPASIEKYEADDIVTINGDGSLTNKTQDKQTFASGVMKLQSLTISDIKVRAYGDTAVATGTSALKGVYKGEPLDHKVRFTDVWVNRNGKWQVVSSQVTQAE